VQAADECMAAQSVKNPARMAQMIVPAFSIG
jgi:hypothetical protein